MRMQSSILKHGHAAAPSIWMRMYNLLLKHGSAAAPPLWMRMQLSVNRYR